MRDRMERLVLLPFSIGCVSESSVAVAVHHRGHHPRRSSKSPPPSSSAAAAHNQNLSPIRDGDEDEESSLSSESTKNSYRLMAVSKPDISAGFNRFFKGFKNFSQMFVYKDEDSEEEDEEIEIGLPTDVKHVTHIGIDGSSAINNNNNNNIVDPINGWDDLLSSPDHHHLLGPVSFQQFKLSSMADPATLVRD